MLFRFMVAAFAVAGPIGAGAHPGAIVSTRRWRAGAAMRAPAPQ
jgi:hypothetical protein